MSDDQFERKTFSKHRTKSAFDATIIVNLMRALIYFAASYYFYVSKWLAQRIGNTTHIILCAAIFLYACYRVYRAVIAYQRSDRNDRIGQKSC